MTTKPTHVHSLCPDCTECPMVEFFDHGAVRIGEGANRVTLRREEWNELVKAIQRGQLGTLAD